MKVLTLLLLVFGIFISSCNRPSVKKDAEDVDSLIARHTNLLFTAPRQADSLFAARQKTLGDSSLRMILEVFRATAARMDKDESLSEKRYRAVEEWCNRHPEALRVRGVLSNHRGVNAILDGNLERARFYYEEAYDCLSQNPKQRDLISVTVNLADIYMHQGDLPRAAENYRYALFLCDSLTDNRHRNSINSGLGQVYMELHNFSLANQFFSKVGKEINHCDLQTQYHYHLSFGTCHYYESRYQEAIASFLKAQNVAHILRNEVHELFSLANMAEIYLITDSLHQASAAMKKVDSLLLCLHNQADTYQKLSPMSKAYIASLHADLAIAREGYTAEKTERTTEYDSLMAFSPRYLMLHYSRLENYARRAGDYQQAYDYLKKSRKYADSLYGKTTAGSVAELALRYERDTTLLRQKARLADYEKRDFHRKAYIVTGLLSFLLISLVTFFCIFLYRKRVQSRLHLQNNHITALKMDIIRNRVSPHYIFNVLCSILPKLRDYPELSQPVDTLIDVLRGNLLVGGHTAVPLSSEIELVEQYVTLHRLSHGEHPQLIWDVSEELRKSSQLVPAMSLQIPVENALKHAFPVPNQEHKITISISRLPDDFIFLSVIDNGVGYNPGRIRRTGRDTGTGLILLSRILNILNNTNPRKAVFRISLLDPTAKGTRVELYLPCEYDYELPSTDTEC